MVVPMPFTRALFLYGEPIVIARDADVEEQRTRVETALRDLEERADRDFDELWKGQKAEGRRQKSQR